jgi:hypothetical protein
MDWDPVTRALLVDVSVDPFPDLFHVLVDRSSVALVGCPSKKLSDTVQIIVQCIDVSLDLTALRKMANVTCCIGRTAINSLV